MIQGERVRLHPGTVCVLLFDHGNVRAGTNCSVLAFDGAAWRVRLHDKAQTVVQVPEVALRIEYCALPVRSGVTRHIELAGESAQGSCGRGLVTSQRVRKGQIIFEDRPLLVGGGLFADEQLRMPMSELQARRWLAYAALVSGAEREQSTTTGDSSWRRALAAFDDLGSCDSVPAHIEAGARYTCSHHACTVFNKRMGVDTSHSPRQHVIDALMKIYCNKFRNPRAGLVHVTLRPGHSHSHPSLAPLSHIPLSYTPSGQSSQTALRPTTASLVRGRCMCSPRASTCVDRTPTRPLPSLRLPS